MPRTSTMPRINTQYIEGHGDCPFNPNNFTPSKDIEGRLYCHLQALQYLSIELNDQSHSEDLNGVLEWLIEASHSIAAFVSSKGQSGRNQLKGNEIFILEGHIQHWKEYVGPASEFVYYEDQGILALMSLVLKVRELEIEYRAWRAPLEQVGGVAPSLNDMGALLNRLSAYLFWATRGEAKAKGIQESYWCGHMPTLHT